MDRDESIDGEGDAGREWRRNRKIVTLPISGCNTPEVILARTLEKAKAGKIKSVIIGIEWEGEGNGFAMDCTVMSAFSFSTIARVINTHADVLMLANVNEFEEYGLFPDDEDDAV